MKKNKPLNRIATNELVKKIKKSDEIDKLNSLNIKELVKVIKRDRASINLDEVLDFANSIECALVPKSNLPVSYSPYFWNWKGRYVLQRRNDYWRYTFEYSRLMKTIFYWRKLVLGY